MEMTTLRSVSGVEVDGLVKVGLRLYRRMTEVWFSRICHAGVRRRGEYKARLEGSRWSWYLSATVGLGRLIEEVVTA